MKTVELEDIATEAFDFFAIYIQEALEAVVPKRVGTFPACLAIYRRLSRKNRRKVAEYILGQMEMASRR